MPWYVGPTYAATVSASDGSTYVALRANVRDITTGVDSSNPHWDQYPGDIRRADVTFYDSNTGDDLCTAEVDLLFAGDTSVGTAECSYLFDIGSADAVPFEISVRVGHWYTNRHFPEETVLMVAKPLDDFMTGGGYLALEDSAGVYAGDEGSKANFGFNVKFSVNKKKVNLRGRVTIIIRQDGRIYKIKSTAIDSAGLNVPNQDPPFFGQFESKANLTDVTDPDNPIGLGGNLKLQMNLIDGGTGLDMDWIQFRLIEEKNGRDQTLLFSSNWDGNQTVLQQLGGGNVTIHGPSGPAGDGPQ